MDVDAADDAAQQQPLDGGGAAEAAAAAAAAAAYVAADAEAHAAAEAAAEEAAVASGPSREERARLIAQRELFNAQTETFMRLVKVQFELTGARRAAARGRESALRFRFASLA